MTDHALPEDDQAPQLDELDRDLDVFCEAWVAWCRVHRLYAPSAVAPRSRLKGGTRALRRTSEEDTPAAAALAAFHIAYTCQPEALDKQVFDLYYLARVKPLKAAADSVGIGRAHFYRVLSAFRRRVHTAARAFESNTAAAVRPATPAYKLQLVANHDQLGHVNAETVS
jgi:hypothetical protein